MFTGAGLFTRDGDSIPGVVQTDSSTTIHY